MSLRVLLAGILFVAVSGTSTGSHDERIERLERLVAQQQRLVAQQQRTISELRQEVQVVNLERPMLELERGFSNKDHEVGYVLKHDTGVCKRNVDATTGQVSGSWVAPECAFDCEAITGNVLENCAKGGGTVNAEGFINPPATPVCEVVQESSGYRGTKNVCKNVDPAQ